MDYIGIEQVNEIHFCSLLSDNWLGNFIVDKGILSTFTSVLLILPTTTLIAKLYRILGRTYNTFYTYCQINTATFCKQYMLECKYLHIQITVWRNLHLWKEYQFTKSDRLLFRDPKLYRRRKWIFKRKLRHVCPSVQGHTPRVNFLSFTRTLKFGFLIN